MSRKKDIFGTRKSYKPFTYPQFYEYWLKHEQMHWISREVALHDDQKDWSTKLTEEDRTFLTNVFLLFTQGDIDVAEGYVKRYLPYFELPEIRMMLLGFAAREATHIDAYSYLIETLGKPDSFYSEFLDIPIMKEKHEYFESLISNGDKKNLPLQIAGISAFTEGMFLFSSFVMLLNYPRNGKMKGMGQIVSWSILDENCLTKSAEVVTSDGEWKKIGEVTLDDNILQYDVNTKSLQYVNPTRLIVNHADEVIEFSGEDFYQEVTPEHRMLIEKDGKEQFVLAKDLLDMDDYYFVLGNNEGGKLKSLTEKHKEICHLYANGEIGDEWIYQIAEHISPEWAEEFLAICQGSSDVISLLRSISKKKVHNSTVDIKKKEYSDSVYCVSVPSTAFVVKQNGKVSVTGNCHVDGLIEIFRLAITQNKEWWTDETKKSIYDLAEKMTELELGFIDFVYNGFEKIHDLSKEDLKLYIKYIVDRRLISMGMKGIHKVKDNPLPWVDEMVSSQNHGNFFETRETSYAKGALTGSWGDVWGVYKENQE